MTTFWLLVVGLSVLAIAVTLLPLWLVRSQPTQERQQIELNTRLFRERLAELDSDHQQGLIDQSQYQQLRTELERTLLSDVPEEATAAQASTSTRWLATGVAVLVPLMGLGYYYVAAYRGAASEWIALQEQLEQVITRALQTPDQFPDIASEQLPDFTRALQARVLRDGMDDPDSLALLGQSLLQMQLPQQAAELLQRAHTLAPQRVELQMAYAQARIMSNAGKLDSTSAHLLQAVLQRYPQHQGALMMLGFGAFNAGDYRIALSAWQPLLASLDPDSEAAKVLKASIERAEQAQQQASLAAVPTPAPPTPADPSARIAVTVDLAPDLRERLNADDTLFIFAKATQGPPMPLAAIRQPVAGFPVSVVLDDSTAMMPSMKLSHFQKVIVGARISKAGDVRARPGDLEGLSEPLNLADGPLSLSLMVDRIVQ